MWKIVLILLLISNFSFSQTITINEAKWCIVNYEQNKEFKKIINSKDSLLNNKGKEIKLSNNLIDSYKRDSINYNNTIKNQELLITNREEKIRLQANKIQKNWLEKLAYKTIIIGLIVIEVLQHKK